MHYSQILRLVKKKNNFAIWWELFCQRSLRTKQYFNHDTLPDGAMITSFQSILPAPVYRFRNIVAAAANASGIAQPVAIKFQG
jgi:hypothetical protein